MKQASTRSRRKYEVARPRERPKGKAPTSPTPTPTAHAIEALPEDAVDLRRAVIMRMQQRQGNTAVLQALKQYRNGEPISTTADSNGLAKHTANKTTHEAALRIQPALGDQRTNAARRSAGLANKQHRRAQLGRAPKATIQRASIADKLLGGVARRLLKQAAAMVAMISDDSLGPLTFLAKAGLLGFLKRLAAVSATKLVKMARKVFAALQSPQYVLGYLIGLLKGFFIDGLAGIFILFYDLGKLAVKLHGFGLKVAKRLGSAAVKALSSDIKGLGKWLSDNAPGLADALLKGISGKSGLSGAMAQIVGYLLGKAKAAATGIGSKIAGGLIGFLSKSKGVIGRALGEVAGRLSGAVLFEIILAVVTSGGGSAITAVKNGARAILSLLGKVGRGIRAVLGPLSTWIGLAMKALKGWILALGNSPLLKAMSTKLEQLFEKLGNFVKSVTGLFKGSKKPAAASTGGRPKVPSEGLPAPASLPKGAKTTTEGLPAPASLPRGAPTSLGRAAAAVKYKWMDPGEALSFAHDWIVKWGGKFVEYVNHRRFVSDWRTLGRTDDVPAAFVNGRGELILDGTRMDIPKSWHARGRPGSEIPRGGTGGSGGTAPRGQGTPTMPPT